MILLRSALHPRWRRLCCAFAAVLLAPFATQALARAQDDQQPADWTNDVPAHIAVVDGVASLERDGRVVPAEENVPLLAGDRLRTDDGRVEILFADGSALDIDKYASVDLLSESLLRLRAGRLRLSIARLTETLSYRVDAAGASALIRTAGEYRLSVSDARAAEPELDLAVIHGTAELSSPAGRTLVRAGTHAFASERTEPSLPYTFNSSAPTAFDRWADDQREARLGVQSTQYLPADLRYYAGALDQNGTWQYEPTYGNVWFPRVDTAWRPYYDGRWSDVGTFGWVWIGVGRWSWPTHHYGRWGVAAGRWFWIPDRHWGPAWVSWAVSPTYVSWCPLGFDGRPAVALATASRYGDARHAWTIVPARTFTGDVVVSRHVVMNQTLAPGALSAFVLHPVGPTAAGPRTRVEPLRSPTSGRDYSVARRPDSERPADPTRVSGARSSRGAGVTTPAPLPDARRATSRSLAPPSPEVPDRPTRPRPPADPTRPGTGPAQPRTDPPTYFVAPSRGAPTRPPAPSDPAPIPASPGARRVAPPAGSRGTSAGAPPHDPPAPAPSPSRGTPPAPPAQNGTPPSRGRSGGAASPASPPASGGGRGAAVRSNRGGGGG
jgi:hypothetical protein